MAQKQKRPRFTTPKGTAVYPRLTQPDTKFNSAGVYSTKWTPLDAADGEALVKQIDAAIDASVEAAKADEKNKGKKIKRADAPYQRNEEDGVLTVGFKMTASGVSKKTNEKWERSPVLFDATGTPITGKPKIGGGSIIRVNYEIVPFYTALVGAGVSLRLVAVQVIKLVEWTANAKSYGFEAEETTEEAAPATAATESSEPATTEDEF